MIAMVRAASVCVLVLMVTACTAFKRFEPRTAEEKAIAKTLDAFLAAYRAQDFAAMNTLTAPEATITAGTTKSQPFQEGIVALRQGKIDSGLSKATLATLVNFQQPRPDSASVESFIHTFTDRGVENSQIRWDLVRRGNQWLIVTLVESTWDVQLHSRGGGP